MYARTCILTSTLRLVTYTYRAKYTGSVLFRKGVVEILIWIVDSEKKIPVEVKLVWTTAGFTYYQD